MNDRERWKSCKTILKGQLHQHKNLLFRLIDEHGSYREIRNSVLPDQLLNNSVLKALKRKTHFSYQQKPKKLRMQVLVYIVLKKIF